MAARQGSTAGDHDGDAAGCDLRQGLRQTALT